MEEDKSTPYEATIKAVRQIYSAIIGITLVLVSVFIPMAFFPGSTGAIYRQIVVMLALSISFSGLLALTLTPALCALLLKPSGESHADSTKHGYFGRFFRGVIRFFGRASER